MATRLKNWALVAVCLLAGCRASLSPRWADLSTMPVPDRSTHPEHGAVVLLDERVGLNAAGRQGWYREWMWHQVVAILDERGLDEGVLYCARGADSEMVFHARVRTPAGEIREVDDADIFETETRGASQDDAGEIRTLVVPGVEVGSVVEYVCLAHDEHIFHSHVFRPRRGLPVEQYKVELRISDKLQAAVRGYGTTEAISKTKEGDYVAYRWAAEGQPAHESESDMVDWTEREPWWVYRTVAYKSGNSYYPFQHTWADTVSHTAVKLDASDEPVTAGAPPSPDVGACKGERRCVIEALWSAGLRLAELRGPDRPFHPRNLRDAFASGRVTASERTVLLVHWLRAAGIEARHALAPERFGFHLDHTYPTNVAFESLLAFIPPDPAHGVEKGIWLDPNCETCAAGDLSPTAVGTDALIFRAKAQVITKPEVEASIAAVYGERGEIGSLTRKYAVRTTTDGDATVTLDETYSALAAWWWWQDRRDDVASRGRTAAETRVRGLDGRSELLDFQRHPFDRATRRGGDHVSFSMPGLGALDGELLVVPLTFLDRETRYASADTERKTDLARLRPGVEIDEVVLDPPAGYAIAALPPEVAADTSMVGLAFEATRTPEGAVRLTRRLEIRAGRFPKAAYPAIRDVYRAADALRRAVVVFRRVESGAPPGP